MNYKITWTVVLASLIMSANLMAQDLEYIWLPEISYSWKQTEKLGLNATFSTFNSIENLGNNNGIEYIEAALIASYSTPGKFKLGGGYKYRTVTPFLDGYQYEHRFLEQIGFSNTLAGKKLSHRIRLEQRIRSSNYVNRIRYRLGHEMPVGKEGSGTYVKLTDEIMTAFNKDGSKGENRILIAIGGELSNSKEFEFGIQYRTQNLFSDSDLGHILLISTKLALSK